MKPSEICEALTRFPLFRKLDAAALDAVASCTRIQKAGPGELLFLQEDPVDAFYAVLEGRVRLYRSSGDGRVQVMNHIGAGRTFAEAAAIGMARFPASAEALTQAQLLRIAAEPFKRLFDSQPGFALAMLASLTVHLHQLIERVQELSLTSAGARLAHAILRMPARREGGGLFVPFTQPRKDLAAELAMTPESLSRLLRKFQDDGWIESRRDGVLVRDEAALLALAEG
ncbi:MAG: Crp/Fnr family transcriptional regulator [Planctomycetes bacterium]|nr:Crp/Fnr family transcriptional regulator [Planctomycetota bacterium]MCB9905616.1 Crp/Fnr family transcriptional regulator [Planctomycetota bacterium]